MTWSEITTRVQETTERRMGEPIIYYDAAGSPVELAGIFDEEGIEQSTIQGAGVESAAPILRVIESKVPVEPRHGQRIDVRGIAYRVIGVEPDGHGAPLLQLERV